MKALIIDDSRAMRMVLSRMLAAQGFEVDDADGGPSALQKLTAGATPDLVTVDWHMPDMQGIDVVTAMRESGYVGKIVMVTTETEMSQMAKALDAGADEYLMKPFTPDAVTDKLRLLDLV